MMKPTAEPIFTASGYCHCDGVAMSAGWGTGGGLYFIGWYADAFMTRLCSSLC